MLQISSLSSQTQPKYKSTLVSINPQLDTINEEPNPNERSLLLNDESDRWSEFSSRSVEDNYSFRGADLDMRASKLRIAAHAAIFPFLYLCALITQAAEFDKERESLVKGVAGIVTFATLVSLAIHIGRLPNTRSVTAPYSGML